MVKKSRSILDDVNGRKEIPPHIPLNAPLTSGMLIDVAVNREAEVWVFHNRPFPGVLEWIEYDIDESRLVFITRGGRLNDFGIAIGPQMRKYLQEAQQAYTYLVHDNKIHDFIRVPLLTRQLAH